MKTLINITGKVIALLLIFSMLFPTFVGGQVLEVGDGYLYSSIEEAAIASSPGDTILVHEGIYPGGMFLLNVQGNADAWIHIHAADGETVILEGGTNSIQFTDAAYLEIKGLIIQGQTGNGMNIDDGGSYDSPTHHVRILDCTFRDMAVDGNNDLLKLSGLDSFRVRGCRFINGADGGSGIDMVGCHYGVIEENHFEDLGSNSIQAKGGTQHIRIQRNFFKNGGQRNINLGGSTGLAFFRPDTAHFEAADLQVYANVFVGGWAGVAYVGSVRVDVANNTFVFPENWVFRILQETVDTTRFLSCGDNWFRNNLVYYGDVSTDVNIGPNTRPQTFMLNHNLWFKPDDPDYSGPNLPVVDSLSLIQQDPLFVDVGNENYQLSNGSPAIGAGRAITGLELDFNSQFYNDPPSIGAFEADPVSGIITSGEKHVYLSVSPNPSHDETQLKLELSYDTPLDVTIFTVEGHTVYHQKDHYSPLLETHIIQIPAMEKPSMYWIRIMTKRGSYTLPFVSL